jgi:ABC-type Fe3+ transport system permease subunit
MFATEAQFCKAPAGLSKVLACVRDWRLLICGLIVTAAVLPALWVSFSAFDPSALLTILHGPFIGALKRSFFLFASVVVAGIFLGWPLGTLLGLIPFAGQRLFLASLAVPLFTPPSLWAIGVCSARAFLPYRHQWWFDGFSGALLTGVVQVMPLVVFASCFTAKTIPGSQVDAATLSGGWYTLLKACARFTLPAATAGAGLGGLLAISDPGPAQIMGYHGIASEILIAFSARYDAKLAAQKSLLLTLFLLPLILPTSWRIAKWGEVCLLGRDTRRVRPKLFSVVPWFGFLLFVLFILVLLLIPILGFIRPLRSSQVSQSFHFACNVLMQSGQTTLRYCLTAAVLAALLGFFLTLTAGRRHQGRFVLLLFCFVFLSVPAALHALGFVGIASQLPGSFDFFTRGGNAPGLAFGLRWIPIPVLFCLQSWSLLPESCHQSAALHGVPALVYHWKVTLPQLLPVVFCSLLLVALATAADVSSTLILLPPGAGTFTTRIFGVIDSTTQRTLSAMCLLYIGFGLASLALFSLLYSPRRRI